MPKEHVEAVRGIYEEWKRGNFRAGVDLYDPLALFIPFADFPADEYYIGKDGIRDFMLAFLAAWTSLTMAAEDFVEAGDSVVVTTRWHGVGKESGIPTERRVFDVWTFRGKTVVRVEFYSDRTEALEAAGLSEQDAHSDS